LAKDVLLWWKVKSTAAKGNGTAISRKGFLCPKGSKSAKKPENGQQNENGVAGQGGRGHF
jgi:hypothetical protein